MINPFTAELSPPRVIVQSEDPYQSVAVGGDWSDVEQRVAPLRYYRYCFRRGKRQRFNSRCRKPAGFHDVDRETESQWICVVMSVGAGLRRELKEIL